MESEKYLPELMAEKDTLDPSFQHSLRLLEQGKRGFSTSRPGGYTLLSVFWGVSVTWGF